MKKEGMTLLEVLLSLAILGILGVISIPIYQSFQVSNDLTVAEITVAQSLRRAQSLSRSMSGDSNWGLHLDAQNIILFQGASFAVRNSNFDEIFEIPKTVSFSGVNEVVFQKFSGETVNTGDIILTSINNDKKTITINEKGTVEY